jgi:hypothetical protein
LAACGLHQGKIARPTRPSPRFGQFQPRGKKVTPMDKVVVAAAKGDAIAEGTNDLRAFKN